MSGQGRLTQQPVKPFTEGARLRAGLYRVMWQAAHPKIFVLRP